jgi:hypothetical protein
MKTYRKGDIRNQFGNKIQDLRLLILLADIRQFGTWLYGKKQQEDDF